VLLYIADGETTATTVPTGWLVDCSDVDLETRVLVSRRLEYKNESLGLGLGNLEDLEDHEVLVVLVLNIWSWYLVSVLKKKSCSFSRPLL